VHYSLLVNPRLGVILSSASNSQIENEEIRKRKGSFHSEEMCIENFFHRRKRNIAKYGERVFQNVIMINLCIGKNNSKPCLHCKEKLSLYPWIRKVCYFVNGIPVINDISDIPEVRPSYFRRWKRE